MGATVCMSQQMPEPSRQQTRQQNSNSPGPQSVQLQRTALYALCDAIGDAARPGSAPNGGIYRPDRPAPPRPAAIVTQWLSDLPRQQPHSMGRSGQARILPCCGRSWRFRDLKLAWRAQLLHHFSVLELRAESSWRTSRGHKFEDTFDHPWPLQLFSN